jgi:hypothetical protein
MRGFAMKLPLLRLGIAATLLAGALAAPKPLQAAAPSPAGKPAKVLPFIEDDWSRGVAEAKARKLPLFVELWAPW